MSGVSGRLKRRLGSAFTFELEDVDGAARAVRIGHREQFFRRKPAIGNDLRGCGLVDKNRWAQILNLFLDRVIELTDGGVFGFGGEREFRRRTNGHFFFRVLNLHEDVLHQRYREGFDADAEIADVFWQFAGIFRNEAFGVDFGISADGYQNIGHDRHVQHLLHHDGADKLGNALVDPGLE